MTPHIEIDIVIEAGDGWLKEEQLTTLCEQAIKAALEQLQETEALPAFLSPSELAIVFTDDDAIKTLNADYRGKDKATNVLSFPQSPPDAKQFGPLLGDLVLGYETVQREAQLEDKLFVHHISHLIIHGFLHLLGYDHETDAEAEHMETLETAILEKLRIPAPYCV